MPKPFENNATVSFLSGDTHLSAIKQRADAFRVVQELVDDIVPVTRLQQSGHVESTGILSLLVDMNVWPFQDSWLVGQASGEGRQGRAAGPLPGERLHRPNQ